MTEYIIYTDGGSRGNPGIGAWAYAIYPNEDSAILSMPFLRDSRCKDITTNNEMELTAILEGLHRLKTHIEEYGILTFNENMRIEIRSDSTYCINTLTDWAWKWSLNGTLETRPNWKIIKDIMDMMNSIVKHGTEILFTKVKGHSGEQGNEYVDHLLNATMDNWTPPTKVDEPELPQVKFMRVEVTPCSEDCHYGIYEIEYSEKEVNEISYADGDVVAVMNLRGENAIIQAFDPNWFRCAYGIDAKDLPVIVL